VIGRSFVQQYRSDSHRSVSLNTHTGTALGAQWALGGDTWVAGCRIPDCTVLPEFNKLNPDMANEKYNTELGIYQPHCGLENVKFAYGHDEYMYQMMVS
jgi:inositol oxygenase